MHKITYFQRKRREGANFSLEQIFDALTLKFKDTYFVCQKIMPFVSSGVFRRLANLIYAPFLQGDINHVTGDINYVAILLKKRKTILTILDLGVLQRTTGIRRKLLLSIWFKWPIYRSKYVTVISEATKLDVLENVKCNPEKIKVIYVPISTEFKYSQKSFNKECPTILQIGGAPNKNLERLIPALDGISCRLLIIGKLSKSNLELLSDHKVNYENRVGITFKEVISCYQLCDILFFASTFEGFGMPILEAQAVGRPVITSNLLSMPEVGGNAAIYVDPYNITEINRAIIKVIENTSLREKLVNNGLKNIDRFDANEIASQYEHLYKSILKSD